MNIHGNEYTLVKDRVAACHAEEGFSMLSEEVIEMRDRSFVRITIECKGKRFIGTSEVKWLANPKTPDGQSPYECAQTSALGRALGFAGYGVVESIASAEEVSRNETANVTDKEELDAIMDEVKLLGLATDTRSWLAWKREQLGKDVPNKALSHEQIVSLRNALEAYKLAGVPSAA